MLSSSHQKHRTSTLHSTIGKFLILRFPYVSSTHSSSLVHLNGQTQITLRTFSFGTKPLHLIKKKQLTTSEFILEHLLRTQLSDIQQLSFLAIPLPPPKKTSCTFMYIMIFISASHQTGFDTRYFYSGYFWEEGGRA